VCLSWVSIELFIPLVFGLYGSCGGSGGIFGSVMSTINNVSSTRVAG